MRSTQRYVAYHFSLMFCAVWRRGWSAVLCAAVAALMPAAAHAQRQELIVDGGFDFGGVNWQVSGTFTSANNGGWFLTALGNLSPLSGLPTEADGGGMGLYVVTDQLATGTMALFQQFTVPVDPDMPALLLSFDMFVNDWSSQTTYNPNQHARVDITGVILLPFQAHIEPSDFNAYLGTDGGPLPNEFRHYEFDILPFVTQGQTYRIRFQTTVGISQLNQGVDNVSVVVVPEPSSWELGLMAAAATVGGLVLIVRRRRDRNSP